MQAVKSTTSQIFASEVKGVLLAQAVRVFLANQRQATAKTKTRSEINRTKKKWFKQKGTGNARHGAQTPAIFVGGGVAHGPTGRQNYNLKLTDKMKKQALLSALASQTKQTFVENEIEKVDGKTKSAVKVLADKLTAEKRVLVIVDEKTPEMTRAFNNLAMAYLTTAARVNVLHVVNADVIVVTDKGLKLLEQRLIEKKQKAASVSAPKVEPTSVAKATGKTVKKVQAKVAKSEEK